MGDQQGKASQS